LTTHAAAPQIARPRPGRERAAERPLWDDRRASHTPESAAERHSAPRDARYRRFLAVADIFAAACALALSIQIFGDDQLRIATILGLPLVVLVSKIIGLYDRDELLLSKSTVDEVPKLFTLAAVYTLVLQILSPYLLLGDLGRDQLLGAWILLFVTLVAGRALARHMARERTHAERLIVVGEPGDCASLAAKLESNAKIKAEVVSMLPVKPRREGETRWTLDAIANAVAYHKAERLIIAPWTQGHEEIHDLVRIAKGVGISVSVLPGVFEVIGSHVEFDEIDGMTVLGVRRFELTRSSRLLKRTTDLAGAGLMMLVGLPILAATAMAIKLTSKGPVFFRQVRVGRDGKQFRIYKLRTMRVGNDEKAHAEYVAALIRGEAERQNGMFKMVDDPRITRVGRVLRKYSLDELPQLWNVLRGDMSAVGPRPALPRETQLFDARMWQRNRVKPGLTGLAQVSGRCELDWSEQITYDVAYWQQWSPASDLLILIKTPAAILKQRGAA
jgi:exopolysaccharide biosynthesis polyprenyl glycosylphosphotransferase